MYILFQTILANKKAIINLKNGGDQCFKWCMTQALNLVDDHAERITKALMKQAEKLDWSGIEFPVAVDENIIGNFERNDDPSNNIF